MNDFVGKLFSLSGKTAIVTGCSRGIGAEIAISFKKAGANVVCLSRSEKPNSDEIDRGWYKQCDITDRDEFALLCKQVLEDFGQLDILVNAAGITIGLDDVVDNYERFSRTIEVNLLGTYQCAEIAASYMTEGGSIINISSIGSLQGFPDNPGYVASKGGVRMLSKSLALDFGKKQIRVNNLVPGYIKTDMTLKSYSDPELNNGRLERMILKRWGVTKDLVGAAIFLASDASSYVTGTDVIVDGGWVAKGL